LRDRGAIGGGLAGRVVDADERHGVLLVCLGFQLRAYSI
jgi:hypothetical protein